MKTERLIGFVLLGVGLILIFFAINGVYSVYTGVSNPPELFKIDSIKVPLRTDSDSAPREMELLKGEAASKFMNMSVWYILMLFILSAAAKIASLGVGLLREIKIIHKGTSEQDSFKVES